MAQDTLIKWTHTAQVLNEYGQAVVDLYRRNLIESDHLATERLLNNLSFEVVTDHYTIAVDLSVMDYFKYVEWDTRPHFPPLQPIKDWIRVRNIIPQPMTLIRHTKTKGDIEYLHTPTEDELAFLIGRKIAREGTEGSHDLENAVEQVNRDFKERIEQAVTDDVDTMVGVVFDRFFDINHPL